MLLFLLATVFTAIYAQVNPSATAATKTLWTNLRKLHNSNKIAFGQEFPTDFRQASGLSSDTTTSDCKTVVGDHPAVFGSDFHYFLYKQSSEYNIHKDAVLAAWTRGAIVTFDWHMWDRYQSTYNWNGGNSALVSRVVNPSDTSGDRAWFLGELDKVINIIKNDFGSKPFVFRPFHEMTGDWFWWGSKNTKADYIKLFQLTFNHFKSKSVNNVLWCWSPDKTLDWGFYPGDSFVDVIGMDVYEPGLVNYFTTDMLISVLSAMTDYATAHGKVAALTETGARDGYSINSNPTFWTSKILNPIKANPKAVKIAWILTWINANWGNPPYVPHSGSSSQAKSDFVAFYNDPTTLFEKDLAPFFAGQPTPPAFTPTPTPTTTPTSTPTPTPTPTPTSTSCTDIAPDAQYTCPQQASWGKCGETWMQGKCNLSCGRCGSCSNLPPDGTPFYTCDQQVSWGKCGETWMQGKCNRGCGRCTTAAIDDQTTHETDQQTNQSAGDGFPAWAIAVIVVGSVVGIAGIVAGFFAYQHFVTNAERV